MLSGRHGSAVSSEWGGGASVPLKGAFGVRVLVWVGVGPGLGCVAPIVIVREEAEIEDKYQSDLTNL